MTVVADEREYRVLPLDVLDEPVKPSRAEMDEGKLEELKASIRQVGLIQPLNVARTGDRYEVIAGHRRLLCMQQLGRRGVPCLIYPTRDAALEAVKYAENRHREDLNPAEAAIWFSELLEAHCGGDTDRLAAFLNEKREYVEGRLLLFNGDEHVFEALRAGKIKLGVAQQLNRVTHTQHCRYLLDAAVNGGATVAIVQGWVTDWKLSTGASAPIAAPTSDGPLPGVSGPSFEFKCYVCHGTEHVHTMRSIFVHDACLLAILDKMLAAYNGDAGGVQDTQPIGR